MLSDLKRIIDQISRDRGFDKKLLISAIEDAVASAARKKLGSRRDIEVRYNEEYGEVEIFQFRSVVEVAEELVVLGLREGVVLVVVALRALECAPQPNRPSDVRPIDHLCDAELFRVGPRFLIGL